jgi:phosphodiesterase/alkaline phosphatase D-like protein
VSARKSVHGRPVARRALLRASAATSATLLACGARTPLEELELGNAGRAGSGGAGGESGAAAEAGSAGADAAGGASGAADPAALPEDVVTFPIGVIAGAMRSDSVVLFTYATVGEALAVQVYRRRGRAIELAAEKVLERSNEGYIEVRVEGLRPGSDYEYAFLRAERNARSAIGRVKTAYGEGDDRPLLLGATACTYYGYQPFLTLSALAEQPIDAFLQMGDMSYNDGSLSLGDYRAAWRSTLSDVGYRTLLPKVGSYFTWDDHEVTNDFDPEAMALTNPSRLAAAKQSYFETLPIGRTTNEGLWQSFRWGSTAEIFVLDCRSERLPSTRLSDDPIHISRAQMDWFKQGLRESTAHYKVVMNSVPFVHFEQPPVWAPESDRWEGYAAQREEILDFIARERINAWFITGGFHIGTVHRVSRTGRDRSLWEVSVGGAAQATRDSGLFQPGGEVRREMHFPSEQFAHVEPTNSCTTFEFDPSRDGVRVRFISASSAVLFDRVLSRAG